MWRLWWRLPVVTLLGHVVLRLLTQPVTLLPGWVCPPAGVGGWCWLGCLLQALLLLVVLSLLHCLTLWRLELRRTPACCQRLSWAAA